MRRVHVFSALATDYYVLFQIISEPVVFSVHIDASKAEALKDLAQRAESQPASHQPICVVDLELSLALYAGSQARSSQASGHGDEGWGKGDGG